MAGKGGAIAVGLADGILRGLEIRRRWERDDEEKAAREEDRAFRRKERERADSLQIALQKAGAPAQVSQPQDVMGDDEGNSMPAAPRFELARPGQMGQRFDTQQQADAAAQQHNDPGAMAGRVSQALMQHGKPTEALAFQKQADEYGEKVFRKRLGEAMTGGFSGIESFINETESGPFKGKRVKFVPNPDGKTVTLNVEGEGGKLTPTQLTFPNDEKGPTIAGYMLDQAVTPDVRYKLMVENDRKTADQERKGRELDLKEEGVKLRERHLEEVQKPLAEAREIALEARAARDGRSDASDKMSREERLRWTSLHSESGRRLSEAQKALTTLTGDPVFMARARKPASPEAAQLANLKEDVNQYKEDRAMYGRLLGGSQAEEARGARAGGAAAPAAAPVPSAATSKVSAATQKARDADRAVILQAEMTKAKAALATATDPEARARAQQDVKALTDEIARLPGGGKAAPAAKAPAAKPSAGKVAAPKSQAEYEALEPGTRYQHPKDPPGTYRTKK